MPLLIISVYMPCVGLSDNIEDLSDCIDPLNEIIQKFSGAHKILLGGDLNEDLVLRSTTSRVKALNELLEENTLRTKETPKTFIVPGGRESTTLDYIFYSEDLAEYILSIETLETLHTTVSDHIPVLCKLNMSLGRSGVNKSDVNLKQ